MQNKRLDFLIEEAGCLIWVAPRSLGGLTPAQLAQVWMGRATQNTGDLVKRGAMMPMSLYQDDGYLVRFILGELSQQEQAEWTARALWKLDITCGEVFISGILTPDFNDEFSAIVPAEGQRLVLGWGLHRRATGCLSSRGIQLPARRPVWRLGYDYQPSNIRETPGHRIREGSGLLSPHPSEPRATCMDRR